MRRGILDQFLEQKLSVCGKPVGSEHAAEADLARRPRHTLRLGSRARAARAVLEARWRRWGACAVLASSRIPRENLCFKMTLKSTPKPCCARGSTALQRMFRPKPRGRHRPATQDWVSVAAALVHSSLEKTRQVQVVPLKFTACKSRAGLGPGASWTLASRRLARERASPPRQSARAHGLPAQSRR